MNSRTLYILTAFVIIFIILYYFSDIKAKVLSKFEQKEEIVIKDKIVKKRRKKYEYSAKKDIRMTEECPTVNILGYSDFLDLYKDEKFVLKFRESIIRSARAKITRYSKIKAEITKSTVKSDDDRIGSSHLSKDFISMIDKIINLAKEFQDISLDNVRDRLNRVIYGNNGLDSLVGRDDMKNFISLIIITFARNPESFYDQFNNMIIMGPSGCGKTKLAMSIGESLSVCGILIRNKFSYITKGDITTAYVNESGKLTRKALIESLESVIFLDEAYDLSSKGFGRDHSDEVITEIINFLDKYIGLNIVIFAGYEDRIKKDLLPMNEGIDRRFPHKFVLNNYSSEDLTSILVGQLEIKSINVDKDIHSLIYSVVRQLDDQQLFDKQAGDILNLCGYITSSFYGSSWDKSSEELNPESLIDGVNQYLVSKQSSVFIDKDQEF